MILRSSFSIKAQVRKIILKLSKRFLTKFNG
jgi:hypothetical protein